jgi:hypothetical protein
VTPECTKMLREEPRPPPFIRRFIGPFHSNYTVHEFPAGWRPAGFKNDFIFDLKDEPSTSMWLFQTVVTVIATYFTTIILAALVFYYRQLDPAASQYPRHKDCPNIPFKGVILYLLSRCSVLNGRWTRSGINRAVLGQQMICGGWLEVLLAMFAEKFNVTAAVLTMSWILLFQSRRFQLKRVPRYIGEQDAQRSRNASGAHLRTISRRRSDVS